MSTDYDNAANMLLKSILSGKKEVENRTKLGPTVPIHLFQALRLIGMGSSIEQMVGEGARALVYRSGQKVGEVVGGALAPKANGDLGKFVELVQLVCQKLGIGLVSVEKADVENGNLILRVDECVSCAGIGGSKAPICNFEAGLVGGLVKAFVNKDVKATEIKCHAVGDSACVVDVRIF